MSAWHFESEADKIIRAHFESEADKIIRAKILHRIMQGRRKPMETPRMNDPLQEFKIWFEGFCIGSGDQPNLKQFAVLKDRIRDLPDYLPKPKPSGTGDLNYIGTEFIGEDPQVPRYCDGDGV